MATSRLDVLKSMLAQNPSDSFARYGLAMEYRKAGDLGAAVEEFDALIAADPDYAAAYFHGGQTLEQMGRTDDARGFYVKGIDVTTRKGDGHARAELEAALDILG